MNEMDRRRDEWHIKKEVTWGHLVSTVLLAIGFISVYADMSGAIQLNSNQIEHIEEIHQKDVIHYQKILNDTDKRNAQAVEKMEKQFDRLHEKLDTLIEQRHNH